MGILPHSRPNRVLEMRLTPIHRHARTLLITTALALCLASAAKAQSVWIGPSGNGDSGGWGTATNWSSGVVPNAVDAEVIINQAPAFGIINLGGGTFTIGTMRVNSASLYMIVTTVAPGTLNFEASGPGNALIEVTQANTALPLFVNTPGDGFALTVNLVSNTEATVAAGQLLRFGDKTTLLGAGELIANGAGTVRIDGASTRTGITRLVSGTIEIGNVGALGGGQLRVTNGTLRANTTGTLANNILVEAGGSMATIVGNGLTVTHTGNVSLSANVTALNFGEVGNTGTFVMTGGGGSFTNPPTFTVDVLGGTLRGTNVKLGFFTGNAAATNIAVGAAVEYLSAGPGAARIRNMQSAGTILVSTGLELAIGGGQSSGAITGDGSVRITTSPAVFSNPPSGTVVLTGANTYTGGTTIDAGANLFIGAGGTTGSIIGNVVNDGTLLFARTDAHQFNGMISGTGSVVNAGGTLILTGDHGYTGGTSVAASATLRLGDGGTTGSILGNVLAEGTLAFNRSNAYQFDGFVFGAGEVQQMGSGTTTLTAAVHTYTGATTVTAGTLLVNGSIATSSGLTVAAGGTVGGVGTLPTSVIDGTLSPGNSIGTINVAGNLTFGAGSTFAVEVSPAGADLTLVSGTANLSGGTVLALYGPGNYLTQQFLILNAAGGLGGTSFAGVTDNSAIFDTTLTYDANNVFLNVSLASVGGLTQNQAAVAGAVQGFFAANGFVPGAFAGLDANGLTLASGEIATAAVSAGIDAAGQFAGVIADPFVTKAGTVSAPPAATEPIAYSAAPAPLSSRVALAALGGEAAASDAANAALAMSSAHSADPVDVAFDRRWKLWGAVYGAAQEIDGDAVVVGSADLTSRNWGVATGFSRDWGDGAGGLALGGAGSTFELSGGLGSGNAGIFNAGLYAGQNFGNAYVSGALAYGWHNVRTTRAVPGDILTGRFNAHSFSGRIEAGYRVETAFATFTPYAGVQATSYTLPAYTETSAAGGAFAVAHGRQSELFARTELGLRAEHVIPTASAAIKLSSRVAWAYNAANERSVTGAFVSLPGQSFTITGARPDRHAALVDLGIEAAFASGLSAKLSFSGEFSSNVAAYGGSAKISYRW
jgi:autotransporter-associated beta strand protein